MKRIHKVDLFDLNANYIMGQISTFNLIKFTTTFSIRVFLHWHWQFTGQLGKRGVHFYSSLPFPSAHQNSHIYLLLCTWDGYHAFLIEPIVSTRGRDLTPQSITIWVTDNKILNFSLLTWWFISELALTITLV